MWYDARLLTRKLPHLWRDSWCYTMIDELIEKWLQYCGGGGKPYDRNEDGTWNYIDISGWSSFQSFSQWLKDNKIRLVNEQ